jgi:hypothetical protein
MSKALWIADDSPSARDLVVSEGSRRVIQFGFAGSRYAADRLDCASARPEGCA